MPQKKSGNSGKKGKQSSKIAVTPVRRTAPTAYGAQLTTSSPKFVSTSPGSTRVRHREYVIDVDKHTDFTVGVDLSINPGNNTFFKWLSTIARNYELYKFHSLRVLYETDLPTSNAGAVALGVDFDAADLPPQNKQEFMTLAGSVRSPVWMECKIDIKRINPERADKFRFIRLANNQTPPEGTSILDFDLGRFFFAAFAAGANLLCGELYVEYDVEFKTPTIPTPIGLSTCVLSESMTSGKFFGATLSVSGDIQVDPSATSNSILIVPPGTFLLMYYADSPVGAYDIDPAVTATSGVSINWKFLTILSNLTPNRICFVIILTSVSPNWSVAVDFSVALTTIYGSTFFICPCNSSYTPNFEAKKAGDDFVVISSGNEKSCGDKQSVQAPSLSPPLTTNTAKAVSVRR